MLLWIILARLTSTTRLTSKQLLRWKMIDFVVFWSQSLLWIILMGTTYTLLPVSFTAIGVSWKNHLFFVWCDLTHFPLISLQLKSLRITWDGVRSTLTHTWDEFSKLFVFCTCRHFFWGLEVSKAFIFTWFFDCALFFSLPQSHFK